MDKVLVEVVFLPLTLVVRRIIAVTIYALDLVILPFLMQSFVRCSPPYLTHLGSLVSMGFSMAISLASLTAE